MKNLKKIWILGGGKFGTLALERIMHHLPGVEITLIDNGEQEKSTNFRAVKVIHEDAIRWLVEHMHKDGDVDIIIPAIPVHVVAEWLKSKWRGKNKVLPFPLPNHFLEKLPHTLPNGRSTIYVSHANFLCPDDCGEPEKYCTVTGRDRGEDLYRLLELTGTHDCPALVIRSYQLYPGVGGIYPKDMWALWEYIQKTGGKPLAIATACRCHGVVDGLRFVQHF